MHHKKSDLKKLKSNFSSPVLPTLFPGSLDSIPKVLPNWE